ncbi:MAG: monovalent cation/H+ antiporter subunit D family protein [Deltaproteobacteria bacterium]|nr:monovalent cation/H+ antiporter subunit D family protein [Deltaproteobacteria bacterium]
MTIFEHLPALLIIIPLLSALIIPIVSGLFRQAGCYISIAATFASLIIALFILNVVMSGGAISYQFGGWTAPIGIVYAIDYLNSFVVTIIAFIGFVGALYAKKSVEAEIDECKRPQFYTIYILFITGMMGIVMTGDIFNLYVFIEIASLTGYALIASGRKRGALLASYNYLILGSIGASFILIGIGYLYMMTGTLNMADLSERLPALYDSKAIRTAFAFFTVGISLKMALFPLHIWLPEAYTKAPSVVSAVMSATSTKVFAYILIRIMFTVFGVEFDLNVIPVTKILLVLSAIAIIAGSAVAIAQTNIKRMLAYSSVGQIGYIVLGVAIANEVSMSGSLIHILNHALMKCSLFLVVGAVIYRTGIEDISAFEGMGRKMPFTMAAFTIGALSMIGLPLTVGFVSKWYLALGALKAGMWIIVVVILVSSLLTAIYFWRIVEKIYFKEPSAGTSGCVEAPIGMVVPTFVMALLCLLFGIFTQLPLSITNRAAAMLLGGG